LGIHLWASDQLVRVKLLDGITKLRN